MRRLLGDLAFCAGFFAGLIVLPFAIGFKRLKENFTRHRREWWSI